MLKGQIKTILIDSYNHHAQERDRYTVDPWKAEERQNFLSLISWYFIVDRSRNYSI